jgi:A/G-specific adenine glycosylase
LAEFSSILLAWYGGNARVLPWRGQSDAYATWVSEIMLQQTRVETVIPYFERWMKRFPRLSDLAQASEQEVLSTWEGLGYYSRARNLKKAAEEVMAKYAGQVPANLRQLLNLPGVGAYTAGAIASIAFGLDEPALDGNIRRVLARLFDLAIPARSPEGERRLWELARQNLPAGRAGDFNQAMMDLGAAVCLPRNPACPSCPLAGLCQALAHGTQEERPILNARLKIPHYTVAAAIIQRENQVMIARRPSRGLLGGLWEFPGGKIEGDETLAAALAREIQEELATRVSVGAAFGVYRHAFTHFRITLHAFLCRLVGPEPTPVEASELRWVTPAELDQYPMGKVDRQISRRLALDQK